MQQERSGKKKTMKTKSCSRLLTMAPGFLQILGNNQRWIFFPGCKHYPQSFSTNSRLNPDQNSRNPWRLLNYFVMLLPHRYWFSVIYEMVNHAMAWITYWNMSFDYIKSIQILLYLEIFMLACGAWKTVPVHFGNGIVVVLKNEQDFKTFTSSDCILSDTLSSFARSTAV